MADVVLDAPIAAPDAPPAQREIKVSEMTPPTTPAAAPKPGSAKERMAKSLQSFADKKAGNQPAPEPAKPASSEPNKAAAAQTAEPSPSPEAPPSTPAEPAATADGKKPSPWKLLDEERKAHAKAQAELTETRKRAIAESDWKSYQEKQSALEKRNKELEDHIRYVDYSKSKEFTEKYEQPYKDSWKRAMDELGELTVDDGGGNARPLKPADILSLVNMPIQRAREAAEAMFGPLANDVMQHRNEIRRLFNEQASALEKARAEGGEWEKQRTEQSQRQFKEVSDDIKQTWSSANETLLKDPKHSKHFMPVEGDQNGNQKLAKGFELADRAFSENPMAPGLTPEQRRGIVERHAAVRNRAAAYGRLVYQLEQRDSRIAELEKELAGYKESEPTTDTGAKTAGEQPAPAVAGTARERMMQELRKRAKPV